MKQDIRLVRKQFRMTRHEESMIKEMMKDQQIESFSEFLRYKLFKTDDDDKNIELWFSLWQSQKLEQVSRDLHEILVVAKLNHQVTQEHVSILLTCVQELIAEVSQSHSLSQPFRDKYMR
ncbi:SAG1252 family conjugative relaxosome accessory protein [Streptococcus sp. ZY1909104]|uniref:SAG1252 family conjugative relaxosome accessory protein n=1 Tax=Streptococcus sp. ZY1909104 TaxID=3233335 RepID=UPI00298FDBED|nr:SAG1252 family conjugative relaxosome accessory protein [Streptococcus suis]